MTYNFLLMVRPLSSSINNSHLSLCERDNPLWQLPTKKDLYHASDDLYQIYRTAHSDCKIVPLFNVLHVWPGTLVALPPAREAGGDISVVLPQWRMAGKLSGAESRPPG